MPILPGNEPEGEDAMSARQMDYITFLLSQKAVSAVKASRIIADLVQLPDRNASGLENFKERLDLENT